jgi:hypothetical protein
MHFQELSIEAVPRECGAVGGGAVGGGAVGGGAVMHGAVPKCVV